MIARPDSGFKCLYLDPPWQERGGGKVKRGADRHYDLMRTADMPGVIRSSGLWTPYRNAHVWMWVTNNFLPDGLWLMKELGATYKSCVAWIKTEDPEDVLMRHQSECINGFTLERMRKALALQIGLGQYLRGTKELLLFGTIGSGQAVETWKGNRDIPDTIRARRGRHSRKPEEAYWLIEDVTHGPRVEFFARQSREGWASWGNAIDG